MKNIFNLPVSIFNQLVLKSELAGAPSPEEYLESLLELEAQRIKLEQAYKQEQEKSGLDLEDYYLEEED